jgi:small GTP-binding protein
MEISIAFVGDCGVGKTSLITSYTGSTFPSSYRPTVLDNYSAYVNVGSDVVTLHIYDTSGNFNSEFTQFRSIIYPNIDAVVLCYSIISPSSFANVKFQWNDEVRRYVNGNIPKILVATHSDLLNPYSIRKLRSEGIEPVDDSKAVSMCSELEFSKFFKCSSITQENLKNVFDEAIRMVILQKLANKPKNKKKKCFAIFR